MTFAKCSECGDSFELDENQRDLEYPLCAACWGMLEDELEKEKARVDAMLDEIDLSPDPTESQGLLNPPTSTDLWLKQLEYSREDHDHAMRDRNRR